MTQFYDPFFPPVPQQWSNTRQAPQRDQEPEAREPTETQLAAEIVSVADLGGERK